jgi:hypothetical protein
MAILSEEGDYYLANDVRSIGEAFVAGFVWVLVAAVIGYLWFRNQMEVMRAILDGEELNVPEVRDNWGLCSGVCECVSSDHVYVCISDSPITAPGREPQCSVRGGV